PEGQGPIIIAIDESGSMTTDYGGMTGEVWSKAVMLALLSIARLQKRDLAVIHFSGPDDLRLDLFPKGEAMPAQVIACASFFFNGGAGFGPGGKKGLGLVGGVAVGEGGGICVSGGVTRVFLRAHGELARGEERNAVCALTAS